MGEVKVRLRSSASVTRSPPPTPKEPSPLPSGPEGMSLYESEKPVEELLPRMRTRAHTRNHGATSDGRLLGTSGW
jgi:hypothetical protein